jgi:UbiD family decarboxylase
MSCPRNLREAIEQLESQNDLRRVRKAVSPRYEAACLLEMAVKRAGPALLFENIEGNSMPVLGICSERARGWQPCSCGRNRRTPASARGASCRV